MGKWIDKRGFLREYVRPKDLRTDHDSRGDEEDQEKEVSEYGITVEILKCPKRSCRSAEVHLYSTQPWRGDNRKKYYFCRTCGHRFRVTEVDRDRVGVV